MNVNKYIFSKYKGSLGNVIYLMTMQYNFSNIAFSPKTKCMSGMKIRK